MRELFDLNTKKCNDHDSFGKELAEMRDDYYPFKEDTLRDREACSLQISQHEKEIAERKLTHNHCKAKTLPKMKEDIQANKDELCKVINTFKTDIRERINKTRETFIGQVNDMKGNLRFVYGVFFLISIFVGWLFMSGSALHAEQDDLKTRQTKIEIANSKIQTDIGYLKENVSDIKQIQGQQLTLMQEILRRLPK